MKRKLLLLARSLVMLISSVITAFAAEEGETTTITILETSDIHGMIFPHDYTTDTPTSIGLAKVFTIVKAEREIDPNLILVENGDNAQGNMIQMFRTEEVVPMVRAMNMMGYDISVLVVQKRLCKPPKSGKINLSLEVLLWQEKNAGTTASYGN